ncbi:putative RING finger domain protein [Xylogone sp. PMI_703]|nr:putative RING finger domain protein [Xylogone sp. PMI_703]
MGVLEGSSGAPGAPGAQTQQPSQNLAAQLPPMSSSSHQGSLYHSPYQSVYPPSTGNAVRSIPPILNTLPVGNPSRSQKRKVDYVDLTHEQPEDEFAAAQANAALAGITTPKAKRTKKANLSPSKTSPSAGEEKRLRRHRTHAPITYIERYGRAVSQRMFLIDRNRRLHRSGEYEEEVFDIAGTTGNIYQVTITKEPHCTCPDAEKGNQCKHIIYVLVNVLKVKEPLSFQLAFLSTELATIFAEAPVTPQSLTSTQAEEAKEGGATRKPIEGDCPICMMEMETQEEIVWCQGACGNNVHKNCFQQWAKTKTGEVKCVYCRTPWVAEKGDLKSLAKSGDALINEEGYVNIASELGISGIRDTSSYHYSSRGYGGSRRYRRSYWRDWEDELDEYD